MEVHTTGNVVGCHGAAMLYEYWLDREAYQKLLECTHTGVPHPPDWHLTRIELCRSEVKGHTMYFIASGPLHFYAEVFGDDFYSLQEVDK